MIDPSDFYNSLLENKFYFFTGVPDSLLKDFCACIPNDKHIAAANEGNALSIACGYNIATSNYGVVYMQNSGLGNIINPLLSLADEKVYKIPMLLIIGYRGEPGLKDEPQHITQGRLTIPLLDVLGIKYFILSDSYQTQIKNCYDYIKANNKPVALIVRKGTFSSYSNSSHNSSYELSREKALEIIIKNLSNDDFIVSTTGKTSREIFEIREKLNKNHSHDFLTVGSMGHTSSLALGISLFTDKNIYCIDGDGAFLMHMGGLAVAIQNAKDNFKYIVINNGCYESVGSQPLTHINIPQILKAFGFVQVFSVSIESELKDALFSLKHNEKTALVINTNSQSRKNLGRPTITPLNNKEDFMMELKKTKT